MRQLPRYLAVSGLLSLLAFAAPGLVIILSFLVLPGFVLMLAPAAFLWLSAYAVGFYAVRRAHDHLRIAAGCATLAIVALGLPAIVNFRQQAAIDALTRADHALAGPMSPVDLLVVAQPATSSYSRAYGDETSCNDLCLALLYGGHAQRVVMTASQVSASYREYRGRVPARGYALRRGATCSTADLPRDTDLLAYPRDDHDALKREVDARMVVGECLVSAPATIDRGAPTISWTNPDRVAEPSHAALIQPPNVGWTLRLGRGATTLAQRTFVKRSSLALPLMPTFYWNAGSGSSYWWTWQRGGTEEDAVIVDQLAAWTGWKLRRVHDTVPFSSAGSSRTD